MAKHIKNTIQRPATAFKNPVPKGNLHGWDNPLQTFSHSFFFPSFRPRSGSGLKQNPHHCQTWRGTLQAHWVQGTSLFSPLDIPWCPHLSKGTFVFIPQTKDMNQDLCILLLSNTIFTVLSQAFIPSVFIHPFMHMTLCLSVLSTKEA